MSAVRDRIELNGQKQHADNRADKRADKPIAIRVAADRILPSGSRSSFGGHFCVLRVGFHLLDEISHAGNPFAVCIPIAEYFRVQGCNRAPKLELVREIGGFHSSEPSPASRSLACAPSYGRAHFYEYPIVAAPVAAVLS